LASIGRYAISSILSSIAIEGAGFPLPTLRSFNLDTTFDFFENIAHERGEGSFHVPDRASLIARRGVIKGIRQVSHEKSSGVSENHP